MGDLFGADVSDYAARCDLIRTHHLALWDVLKYCERQGSLDAAIKKDSMIVNDFAAFFKEHKSITHICLNGGTAARVFQRHVIPKLSQDMSDGLTITPLPSTSPAHAGMSYAEKRAAWSVVAGILHVQ